MNKIFLASIVLLTLGGCRSDDLRRQCIQKGGIWVDRTESHGKYNNTVDMGCFKPDAFIQLEEPPR